MVLINITCRAGLPYPCEFGLAVWNVVFLAASVVVLRLLLLRECRDDVAERQQTLVDGDAFLQGLARGQGFLHALAARQVHL